MFAMHCNFRISYIQTWKYGVVPQAEWSRALPMAVLIFVPLPGFKSCNGHVRKLQMAWDWAVLSFSYSSFPANNVQLSGQLISEEKMTMDEIREVVKERAIDSQSTSTGEKRTQFEYDIMVPSTYDTWYYTTLLGQHRRECQPFFRTRSLVYRRKMQSFACNAPNLRPRYITSSIEHIISQNLST